MPEQGGRSSSLGGTVPGLHADGTGEREALTGICTVLSRRGERVA
jgi:hypothetical protein